MSSSTDRRVGSDEERSDSGLTWRKLVFAAGVLATLAMGAVSLALGDLEGGAVTFAFAVATWLTRVRKGTSGAAAMTLLSAITLYFMLTAAITNIGAGSPMSSVFISSLLAAVALLGLAAAAGFLFRRDGGSGAGPLAAVASSALLLGGLLMFGASTGRTEGQVEGIHLVSEKLAFSETELVATPGEVTVTLENRDLFWHTFTIEELGVDLRVPVGAEIPITFQAPLGVHRFICAIPGHPEAGMSGTLTVEG